MKLLSLCLLGITFCACTRNPDVLRVKQYTMRDINDYQTEEPLTRNEKMRRLYGAVSIAERASKLGQYYTVLWNNQHAGNREIVFFYRQGGSKIHQIRRTLPSQLSHGKETFSMIGEEYRTKGRILAWKIDFLADGKALASEQSYLWE